MPDPPDTDDARRSAWTQLVLLAAAELLGMALWFSATAVAPALEARWQLSAGAAAWLTMSVQLGFVAGALASAVLNLSDRLSLPRLMAACSLAGALFNAAMALAITDTWAKTGAGLAAVLLLRFLTGVTLAGVYPTGMKLMATWFARGRGLAIGILVGALSVGSAAPHLLSGLALLAAEDASAGSLAGAALPWRAVVLSASASALVAAALAALTLRPGPHLPAAVPFDWRYFARVFTEPSLRRANFGYLGHMFELYAMWAWAPQLLLASYAAAGYDAGWAKLAGFATVAIGGAGCVAAGWIADRWGRCATTIVSLAISGGCACLAGGLVEQPLVLTAMCLLWGMFVVADSAQFSAAVSELCDPRYVGTALTMQTCAGFLLTTVTIRAVPLLQGTFGWQPALALLALGPAFGIYHMARLRATPAAARMAGSRR